MRSNHMILLGIFGNCGWYGLWYLLLVFVGGVMGWFGLVVVDSAAMTVSR